MTLDELKRLVTYDPSTGLFTRLRTNKPADVVKDSRGYKQVFVDGKYVYSHRLAFLYMTGELPCNDVDHINLDKTDNRWSKLREATRSQNLANRKSPNRKLPRGVSLFKGKYYRARAKVNGKEIHGGYFDTAEEAASKAKSIREEAFGEYNFKEGQGKDAAV